MITAVAHYRSVAPTLESRPIEDGWEVASSAAADAGAGGLELTVLESTAAASAGVRAGRGMTTYYLRTRADAFDAGA